MIQQVVRPQSELELFFASMCKTVEKFDPMEQAKIKIEVSRIISNTELAHIQKSNNQNNVILSVNTQSQNNFSNQMEPISFPISEEYISMSDDIPFFTEY